MLESNSRHMAAPTWTRELRNNALHSLISNTWTSTLRTQTIGAFGAFARTPLFLRAFSTNAILIFQHVSSLGLITEKDELRLVLDLFRSCHHTLQSTRCVPRFPADQRIMRLALRSRVHAGQRDSVRHKIASWTRAKVAHDQ